MWKTGALGEHTAKQLCYLVGINFALRGGSEHKNLRQPGFDPQIMYECNDDGLHRLIYREDAASKTNQGGMRDKYNKPRVIYCYESDDWE